METDNGMDNLIRDIEQTLSKFDLSGADMPIQTQTLSDYGNMQDNRKPDVVVLGSRGLVYRLGPDKRWMTAGTDVLQDPTEDCPLSVLEKAKYEMSRITIVEDEGEDVDHFFIDRIYQGSFGLIRVRNNNKDE